MTTICKTLKTNPK